MAFTLPGHTLASRHSFPIGPSAACPVKVAGPGQTARPTEGERRQRGTCSRSPWARARSYVLPHPAGGSRSWCNKHEAPRVHERACPARVAGGHLCGSWCGAATTEHWTSAGQPAAPAISVIPCTQKPSRRPSLSPPHRASGSSSQGRPPAGGSWLPLAAQPRPLSPRAPVWPRPEHLPSPGDREGDRGAGPTRMLLSHRLILTGSPGDAWTHSILRSNSLDISRAF